MTKKTGLFANPADHSLSPLMHQTAFNHRKIDATYQAYTVFESDFANKLTAIREPDWLGVNLSMPYKEKVISYLDGVEQEAQIIGAVNTIVNDNGRLIGYNTDGQGFLADLAVRQINIQQKAMTIIGTGGTAAAILCAAAFHQCPVIYIYGRKGSNYNKIRHKIVELQAMTATKITLIPWDDEVIFHHAVGNSYILVNATNVGMLPDDQAELFTAYDFLHHNLFVYDVIYAPYETKLLKAAKKRKLNHANGLGMLIHQGAKAFELWTKQQMPINQVTETITSVLSKNEEEGT